MDTPASCSLAGRNPSKSPRVTVRGLSRFNGYFLKKYKDVHRTHLLEMVGPAAEAAIYI